MTTARYPMALAALLSVFLSLTGAAAAQPLAGSEWRPVAIGDVPVEDRAGIFLQFRAEGRIAGHGGCNRFFGSYERAGGRLAVGSLATTRKACPGPVMTRESLFLKALGEARAYRRERIDLTLFDAAGRVVMRLAQTDAD